MKQTDLEMMALDYVTDKSVSNARIRKKKRRRMLVKRKPTMGNNKNSTSKSANKISKMLIMNSIGFVPT